MNSYPGKLMRPLLTGLGHYNTGAPYWLSGHYLLRLLYKYRVREESAAAAAAATAGAASAAADDARRRLLTSRRVNRPVIPLGPVSEISCQ